MSGAARLSGLAAGLCILALSGATRADVDARRLASTWLASSWAKRGEAPTPSGVASDGRLRVMLEHAPVALAGAVELSPGFTALTATPATLAALPSGIRAHWSPPRRPLLNLANNWVKAGVARNLTGLSGSGVVVGIVDTGFDPTHPDFRDADGKTRVAWVLDLSRSPTGKHPSLEASFGCTNVESPCAIFSAPDLDEMIAADSKLLPRDAFGHGTHVASLAAGNGSSTTPAKYAGVAPEATLIIVRVTRSDDGSIYDPDVALATRFVFDRATALGMPAVVNLSLGSDFGGHDGSAALERSLAEFVGPTHPGRAIVVAAGNSAGVYSRIHDGYPGPFGIHTEVHVPRASDVRIPILTPAVPGKSTTRASVFVWIASRPEDALTVGVDDADGEIVTPLDPGQGGSVERDGLTATVINRDATAEGPIPAGNPGAVVVLEGTWKGGETFAVRLGGHGSASLWLQSEGDLTPGASGTGALFPRALKEGTIGIPATGASLIAAGATLNRSSWVARDGSGVRIDSFGSVEPKDDSAAFFSGVGPSALGVIKPDIAAPGAFVIGAMSKLVDPATNGNKGLFAGLATCSDKQPQCLVVDDFHAVTSGTSMAAPIVSGAIALLFQRRPTLSQPEVLALLQAGARRATGNVTVAQQIGPGVLNVQDSLAVLDEDAVLDERPSAKHSWLVLGSALARPDPNWEVVGLAQVRGSAGHPADGFVASRLRLEIEGGTIAQPLRREAAGTWSFRVSAPAGSGGDRMRLRLTYEGEPIAREELRIGVDPWVVDAQPSARGGCAVGSQEASPAWALLLLGIPWLRRWRRR
ncbi:MAG: S8 family serine peptidase [Polyangiaceae bacterium]